MLEDTLYGPDGFFSICPPPDWWVYNPDLKAPYPWFGAKSKAADMVWERFGSVKNYCEPFYATGAVLLARPDEPVIETANDFDGFTVNFWRAVQWDPDAVAAHCDWPVNETDLHARHKYLVKRKALLKARLEADPHYYNAEIAGWWVWGLCAWIGAGWCQDYGMRKNGTPKEQPPFLIGRDGTPKEGQGVHAKSMRLPHLGAGTGGEDDHACAHYGKGMHGKGARGLSQRMPHIGGKEADYGNGIHGKIMRSAGQLPVLANPGSPGNGVHSATQRSKLVAIMRALANRLRYVRFTCGDFERILSPAVTWRHGLTGVFLDPPYPSDAGSTGGIYSSVAHERETFDRAFRYCVENGGNRDLRIALCYYEGTFVNGENVSDKLRSLGWSIVEWKADGGYGGQSGTNENRHRERIAFSPHCLTSRQATLFSR